MSFKTKIFALAAKSLTPVPYTCPVTGEKAYVKRFTVAERESYARAVLDAEDGLRNATGFVLIACDKNGELLFEEKDIEQIAKLPEDVVSEALSVFNTQKLPTVEEAEKN